MLFSFASLSMNAEKSIYSKHKKIKKKMFDGIVFPFASFATSQNSLSSKCFISRKERKNYHEDNINLCMPSWCYIEPILNLYVQYSVLTHTITYRLPSSWTQKKLIVLNEGWRWILVFYTMYVLFFRCHYA